MSVVSRSLVRTAFLVAPFLGFVVFGCGGGNEPTETVEVDKAEVQSKEKMIEDAYKNQAKPKKSSEPTKSNPL